MNIERLWLRIPESWRKEITSLLHTFFSVFFLQILVQLSTTGGVPTSKDALVAIVVAAVRSAWKIVFDVILNRAKSTK